MTADVWLGQELTWTLHKRQVACGERVNETRADEMTYNGEAACDLRDRSADEWVEGAGMFGCELSYERGEDDEVDCGV